MPFLSEKCLFGLLGCSIIGVLSLEFDMTFQTKCMVETVGSDVLVVVEYSAFNKHDRRTPQLLTAQVEDPKGRLLYDKKEASGVLTFTSKEAGEYRVCFSAPDAKTSQVIKINLDWRIGVAATNWDEVAKKEHLDSVHVHFNRINAVVAELEGQMRVLRNKEIELRDLNEATHARVARLSVGSVIICVAIAGWQVWYLKRFFYKKKII